MSIIYGQPEPDAGNPEAQFLRALNDLIAQQQKAGVQLSQAEVVAGCDGKPVAFVADGSSCRDMAKAAAGGQLSLAARIGPGGQTGIVQGQLGRAFMPAVGFAGMTAGALASGVSGGATPLPPGEGATVVPVGGTAVPIPQGLAAGADALGILPFEREIAMAMDDFTQASPGALAAAKAGGDVTGFTGDADQYPFAPVFVGLSAIARRMMMSTSGGSGLRFWNNIKSGGGTSPEFTSTPWFMTARGEKMFVVCNYGDNVHFYHYSGGGAEFLTVQGNALLPELDGNVYMAHGAPIRIGANIVAIPMHLTPDGTGPIKDGIGVITGWYPDETKSSVLLGSANIRFEPYAKSLAADVSGRIWAAARYSTPDPDDALMRFFDPPYSEVAGEIHGGTDNWGIGWGTPPCPIVASRDGQYIATGRWDTSGIIDIWTAGQGSSPPFRTLSLDGAYSSYPLRGKLGSLEFGPDGRLFAVIGTAGSGHYLVVWERGDDGYGGAPAMISLPLDPGDHAWLSVSADGMLCAVSGRQAVEGDRLLLIDAPFTSSAAVTTKTLSFPINRMFAFDTVSDYSNVVSGVNATFAITGIAPVEGDEEHVDVTCTVNWSVSGACHAAHVTAVLPDGAEFVSASDGGAPAPVGVLLWWLGEITSAASGELTLVTRHAADTISVAESLTIELEELPAVPYGTEFRTVTQVRYRNNGALPAFQVKLVLPIPAGRTFVSATGGGAVEEGAVRWFVPNLAAGGSGTVEMTLK